MMFDMEALSPSDTYKQLISTIVPRPIAWVTTVDVDGNVNAAPYSFFNAMCGSPPIVCVGIGGRRPGDVKDTGNNIRATGQFVVNLVNYAVSDAMSVTATEFDPGFDEMAAAGLTRVPATKVAPPMIAESPVNLECVRHVAVDVGNDRVIVMGRVVAVHVRDDCVLNADRRYIDTDKLDLVGRMGGGGGYCRTSDRFEVRRVSKEEFFARR